MTDRVELTRRAALQGVAAILGTPVLTALGAAPAAPRFLTAEELAFVRELGETFIPETDTPGARSAEVHMHFDAMMADWASAETQARFRTNLAALNKELSHETGGSFAGASPELKTRVLSAYDKAAFGAERAERKGYREIKELIVSLYYSTEAGASVELQYLNVPGEWLPCVPVEEIGRAWSH